MGLTDIDYSTSMESYVINGNWCSHGIQLGIQIVFVACFYGAVSGRYVNLPSESGNDFHHIYILTAPITQILVNIWLRVKQESQLIILTRLTDWSRDLGVNTLELNRPKWLYRIWVAISVLYACDIVFARFYFNVNQSFGYYLAMSGYIVLLVRTNYIILCYTAMVNLVIVLLEEQAKQLQWESTITVDRLAQNLSFHDKLFLLCHEQIVEVYGGSLVFLFLYTVLDAICTCYLASLEERFSFVEVLFVLCWIVPIFMSLIIPLTANNLTKQVSEFIGYRFICILAVNLGLSENMKR